MGVNFTNKEIRDNRLGNVTFMGTKVTEYLFNDKLVWKYVMPDFTIAASAGTVSEGESVEITITATRMKGGEVFPYTITGITKADLTTGDLKGFFELSGIGVGTGRITIGIKENTVVGDDRTMVITLDETPHIYTSVEVIDETIPPIEGALGLFYGGVGSSNTVTRLGPLGTVRADDTVVGEGSAFLAGVGLGGIAMFYGGTSSVGGEMLLTRIDREGVMLSTGREIDGSRENLAGGELGATHGLFIGGWDGASASNRITKVSEAGNVHATNIRLNTGRYSCDGVGLADGVLFYGGILSNGSITNSIVRMKDYNVFLADGEVLGIARSGLTGVGFGNVGVFHGGYDATGSSRSVVTRINMDATMVGYEANVGAMRGNHASARADNIGLFQGGEDGVVHGSKLITRINSSGVLEGIEFHINSAARRQHAGAGI